MSVRNKSASDSLRRKIDACKTRIAAERDKLRELINDADSIATNCDDAIEDLEHAADTLSMYL